MDYPDGGTSDKGELAVGCGIKVGWGIKRDGRYVLGAQNLPDISIFNFPAKSARIGAASSGDIAIISS